MPADSPRLGGENVEYTRILAAIETRLPAIVVHRSSMRVIDGMHRLRAARLRGDDMIEVRYFDGSEQEAFVHAVRANTAHGMPLSQVDRVAAAERIIASHPAWSDRAIAAATGLGARTIGSTRRRLEAAADGRPEDATTARIGRDGRVRPLDQAQGRLKASEIIRSQPGASLRAIARDAGVSPSTARDVRKRIERGDDPLPQRRTAPRQLSDPPRAVQDDGPKAEGMAVLLRGLMSDPTLRFSDSGRTLLRWISSRAIHAKEWRTVAGAVPLHCTYVVADVARQCADEWLRLAEDLEKRANQVA